MSADCPHRREPGRIDMTASYRGDTLERVSETVNALDTALMIAKRLQAQAADRKLSDSELKVRFETARSIAKKAIATLDDLAEEFFHK